MKNEFQALLLSLVMLTVRSIECVGQQPGNYVTDPKYLLTSQNTEIWDKQGNLYHLIGVSQRIPSSLVFTSINNIKVKFNGKPKYFVNKILAKRNDLKTLFGHDTTAGYRIVEQDIINRVEGLKEIRLELEKAKRDLAKIDARNDIPSDSVEISSAEKTRLEAIVKADGDLISKTKITRITLSKNGKTIDFIAERNNQRLKLSGRTESWPLLRLDSIAPSCVNGISKGPGGDKQYDVKIYTDPGDPKKSKSETVNVGDKLTTQVQAHNEALKTGDLIALNPNYEFVFAGANTTNFRSWAYKYQVADYGLIALPLTYQFGFGGSAPNNVANLTNTLSFGGYYGRRFGNVSYRYGQFAEAYRTFCFYLGGNEVPSSALVSTQGSNGNPSTSNYLSYSLGLGCLMGNNVFSAGLVTSIIHVIDVKSPYDYPYQNHAQLSLVIGVSLNGK